MTYLLFEFFKMLGGSLKVGVTVSAAASNRTGGDDDDSGTNQSREELNMNSNNGNDLADDELPAPTICVYGSNGMAGPLGLDITSSNDLPDDSRFECNVGRNYYVFFNCCLRFFRSNS